VSPRSVNCFLSFRVRRTALAASDTKVYQFQVRLKGALTSERGTLLPCR
jgi:hypothetical protein